MPNRNRKNVQHLLWVALAEVATTSTTWRRANKTNSYKNCELFTGIVVVVALAYFALDSPSRFSFPLSLSLSLLLCTSVSALLPEAAATARHRQSRRQRYRQTRGNGDASSAVSVSFVVSVSVSVGASVVRASRRVGLVVCFVFFANIKSIFLAGIICRLTQPQAQRQRQVSHELNLFTWSRHKY